MNSKKKEIFVNALTKHQIFKRLNKVTTMLPPPGKFTNRLQHTEDVVDVAGFIKENIIDRYKIKRIYNFAESCYVHDIGHCCFAHESEEVINDFIAEQLCVTKDEVCFSHAVNGALVLACAAKPNRIYTDLSKLELFKKNEKNIDVQMIVDSMIKHSFKDYYNKGIYFKYIDDEYFYKTNKHIFIFKEKDKKPLFPVGYYVRVADDIASKNSDVLDLSHLYYGNIISKRATVTIDDQYYVVAKKYIKQLDSEASTTYKNFKIEDTFNNLDLYKKQKELLKLTYKFDYKKQFTTRVQGILKEILNMVCEDPIILRECGFSRKYAGLRRVFLRSVKRIDIKQEMNNYTISLVKKRFYDDPYNLTSEYYVVYHRYICAIAYQISNLTDLDFIKFINHKVCFCKLTKTSKENALWLKKKYRIK